MSFYVYYPPNNEVTAVITGPITVDQGTTPWIVSGTVIADQGTTPWTVDGTVAATQSGIWNIGTVTTITDPVTVNQGTNPWTVDGTVNAVQSGAWTTGRTWTLNSGTDSVTIAGSVVITGPVTVDQGTTPWIIDGAVAATQSGTWNIGTVSTITNPVTVNQGTSPWVVSGTIVTSPNVNIHDSAGNSLNSTTGALDVFLTNPVDQGGAALPSNAWYMRITDGTTTAGIVNFGLSTYNVNGNGADAVPIRDGGNSITVDGTVTSTQGTSPWVVSGTVAATQSGTWNIGTVSTITNPVTVNQGTSPWVISGSTTVSGTVTANQGTSPWVVSGTVAATQSGIWNIGTVTTITNPVTVNQGTSPWVISGSTTVSGTVTANQGTSPWVVSGTVTSNQGTSPWVVSGTVAATQSGTWTVQQGTPPWSFNQTQVNGVAVSTGNGTAGTGTQRVTIASDNTPFTVNAAQSGTWTTGRTWTLSDTTDTVSSAPIDGIKATYSSSFVGLLTGATNTTDIFTITGSSTKTIRILEIGISGDRTTSSAIDMLLIKRSTANSGGTGFPVATAPHDSNNPASTTVPVVYTTSPTLGTTVAVVRSEKMFLNAAATGESDDIVWTFGNNPGQAIVLRGASQVLSVNLNGVTVTGGTFDIYITWTEE